MLIWRSSLAARAKSSRLEVGRIRGEIEPAAPRLQEITNLGDAHWEERSAAHPFVDEAVPPGPRFLFAEIVALPVRDEFVFLEKRDEPIQFAIAVHRALRSHGRDKLEPVRQGWQRLRRGRQRLRIEVPP